MKRVVRLTWRASALLCISLCSLTAGWADSSEERQWDFAVGLYNNSLYKQAFTEFEKYLKDYPAAPRAETAQFFLGECSYQDEDYAAAKKYYQTFLSIAKNPDYTARAKFRLGEVEYRLKNYAAAKTGLQQALDSKLDESLKPAGIYFLGKSQLAAGEEEAGIQSLEKVITSSPASPYAVVAGFDLVDIYRQQNKIDKAITAADQAYALAKEKQPDRALQALRLLGTLRESSGDWQKALSAYQQMEKEFGALGERESARYNQARCLSELGRKDEALAALEGLDFERLSKDLAPRAANLAAGILFDQEQWRKAYDYYRKALGAIPTQEQDRWKEWTQAARMRAAWCALRLEFATDARKITAAILQAATDAAIIEESQFVTAESYYLEKNYVEAEKSYQAVLAAQPNGTWNCQARYKSAWCAYQQTKLSQVEEGMASCLKDCPNLAEAESAWLILGEARFSLKQWDTARAAYGQLLEKYPSSQYGAYALFQRGVAAYQRTDWDGLSVDYEKLLEKYPDSSQIPDALYWLGYARVQKGDLSGAGQRFQQLTTKYPKHELAPDGLLKLGVAQYQQEATAAAAATFLQIINNYPDETINSDIMAWLGDWLIRSKRLAEGLKVLDKAIHQQAGIVKDGSAPKVLETMLAIKMDALAEAGRWPEAGPVAEQLVKAFPQSQFALMGLYTAGKRLVEESKFKEALVFLDQASTQAETSPFADALTIARVNLARGDALFGLKEYEQASKPYLRTGLLFIHPELTPEALYKAGLCFQQLGKNDDAKKRFQAVLSDYGTTVWANKAKDRLAGKAAGAVTGATP